MNPSLAPFHRLLADERRRQATDSDLLRAFVQRRENDAFAELLRRHGPMVLHLAMHLLHQRQDAEDVFQATFLTLANKAHSLRNESSVGAWLHRVAWRLAARCRKRRAARRKPAGATHTGGLTPRRSPDQEVSLREAQALLHQELAALPERLRLPLVLCYLQGQTRDEAARRLDWSLGTLKRRLEQGRKVLHARLSRRGLALSAVLSACLLTSVEVSASLTKATLNLTTSPVAGSASLPASVAILLAEMSWSAKAKALGGLVLLLGVCAGAGAWMYRGDAEAPVAAAKPALPNQPPLAAKRDKAIGPARDQFGDPLPAGAIARLGTVRLRHGDYLRSIRYAPDGKTLISLGRDGVRVWEAATGKPVRHFGAGKELCSIDLSPDGRRVALSRYHAGLGGPVEVWDVATGKLLHKLGHLHYEQVQFSPDGKQLAARTNIFGMLLDYPWNIYLWDTESGREICMLAGPKEHIGDMKFSGDGKALLLGGSSKSIIIQSLTDSKEVRRLRDLPADVASLSASPSGGRIAFVELWTKKSASGQVNRAFGTRVFLVNSQTGAELRRWSVKPEYSSDGVLQNGWWSLAFSAAGRRLAACQQHGPVHIWDTNTGAEKRLLPESRQHSGGVAFSPDGKTLAVGEGGRLIRLIDAESGADRVPIKGHRDAVAALAVSRDGEVVFTTAEEGTIHRWEVRTGREQGRIAAAQEKIARLRLAPDDRLLFSQTEDGTLRAWNVDSSRQAWHQNAPGGFQARLSVSPNGAMLAAIGDPTTILKLFNASTGAPLREFSSKTPIWAVAFGADSSVVFALTGRWTVRRWETTTGRPLPDLMFPVDRDEHYQGSNVWGAGESAVLSADGRLAAFAYDDKFLRLIDVFGQHEFHRFSPLPGAVAAMTFAPDGRTFVWADRFGVIHWLELASRGERRTLLGHGGAVSRLVFTANGKRLVSGSGDTTALVWDLMGQGPASLSAVERDACWMDLTEKDAAKAYRAVCRLIAAPTDALALLRPHLKPVEGVDERRIERWIADLDADAFAVREKAAEELRKLGELAEPACRKALAARPNLETRRRLQASLEDIVQRQWQPSPEILRQLRAVEVLERLGTPEARKMLATLAGGAAGARLTREAQAAMQRSSTFSRDPKGSAESTRSPSGRG